ncbi:MAG: DUF4115 domain-containing protein [Anaerolineaceae bacterium]|nr:DUF4115 domain-containing protein [Anaerolineaceae bacterium]
MSIEAGNILREAREQRGISIKDASDSLHIRIPYLQALESGRAEIIPSVVQARGFLRIYAEYLNISAADIIQEWDNPGTTALSVAKNDQNEVLPEQSAPTISAQQPVNVLLQNTNQAPVNTYNFQPNQTVQNVPVFQQRIPINQQNIPSNQLPREQIQNNFAQMPEVNANLANEAAAPNDPDQNNQDKEDKTESKKEKRKKKKSGIFSKKPAKDSKQTSEVKEDPQALFDSIGSELAVRRKFLALSLEDCESQTLIRSMYLDSMEKGNFEELPSLIQARGMLNNYASFLDLDVDAVMLKFATALQLLSEKKNRRGESKKAKPTRKAGWLKKFFTPDLFVGIFVIVGIAGIIIYSAITITAYRRSVSQPTPDLGINLIEQYLDTTRTPEFLPSPSATMMMIQNQSLSLSTEAVETEVTESAEFTSNQPVQIFINANQRALMRVVSDGKEVFSGRTLPNNTYPFDAGNEIELSISNADAISVVYNQQNLGRLGKLGENMTVIFSPFMAATPTPQFSPTPTNTYEPTYTPQPETPLPTNTPTPYIP